jgi:hemerythrin superfamily protein
MIPDPRGETPKEVPMDAMQLLKQEHEHAKQVFAQIRAASDEQRGRLWTRLKPELKVHEQMEETVLYGPIAREVRTDEQLKDWEEHHRQEVAEVESLIGELGALDPAGEPWMEKIGELQDTLGHHIKEEEGDVWPRIQQMWDRSRLEEAGQHMEAMKRQNMQQAA